MPDEEDVFNKLMETPTGSEKKTPTQEELKSKKGIVNFAFDPNDNNELLLVKFRHMIEEVMKNLERITDLETYLKNGLGENYSKIRGAVDQYKNIEISHLLLVTSGIYTLKKEFIELFIEFPPETEIEPVKELGPLSEPESVKESEPIIEPVPLSEPESVKESKPTIEPVPLPEPKPFPEPELVKSAVPEPEPLPEPEWTKEPESVKEPVKIEEPKSEPQIIIPSILFDTSPAESEKELKPLRELMPRAEPELVKKPEPIKEPEPIPELESIKESKPVIKPVEKPEISVVAKPEKKPERFLKKIEHVMPKGKMLSPMKAMEQVDVAITKMGRLEPMEYDQIDDSDLKMVNIGESLPGSPLFDEFREVTDLIHAKQYDKAEKILHTLKNIAEKQGLDYQVERIEDKLTNMSVYKMIPVLVEAGDKFVDTDPRKAGEKYKKALNFAKLLGDVKYKAEINKLISEVKLRLDFKRKQKKMVIDADEKLKAVIKDNISRLGRRETLQSLEQIKKYCNLTTKSDEFVMNVIIEMIEKKEIYAKLFTDSKKILFDKESNSLFGRRDFLKK